MMMIMYRIFTPQTKYFALLLLWVKFQDLQGVLEQFSITFETRNPGKVHPELKIF